jgi:CDP-6-deoxy-D-xylo-4-hexulose-3-dehydrase
MMPGDIFLYDISNNGLPTKLNPRPILILTNPNHDKGILALIGSSQREKFSENDGVFVSADDLNEGHILHDTIFFTPYRQILVLEQFCKTKFGSLNPEKLKKILKKQVEIHTKAYFTTIHDPAQNISFIPGKSRVNYAGRVFDEREMTNLMDSVLDFWLTYGDYSRKFEKQLAEYLGVRWALLVNSGSSANLLAFMALTSPFLGKKQVKRGDEVITVAAAFPTTVSPVVQYGAVPVFVDVNCDTFNIDTSQLEAALSDRTKAVMLAHTLGNPFELQLVKTFCEKHNLWLVEDNCDALGSMYNGKKTGTWGDIGTSSFYPAHHMTTGEGGAVYTNDPLLKKVMLSIRDWGRDCWCDSGKDDTCGQRFAQQHGTLPFGYDHKYVYSHFGYNLKASDMQAAVGVAQLEKLPGFVEKRKENFAMLFQGLADMNDVFILPQGTPGSEPSWFGFPITLRDGVKFSRNQIAEYLEGHNIQTRNLFGGNLVRHPMFASLKEGQEYRIIGNLKNTDKITNDSFWLGVYPGMKPEAIQYMINQIHAFIVNRK